VFPDKDTARDPRDDPFDDAEGDSATAPSFGRAGRSETNPHNKDEDSSTIHRPQRRCATLTCSSERHTMTRGHLTARSRA
jgi:hypothetical protein